MSLRIYFGPVDEGMPRRAAEQAAVRALISRYLPALALRYRPSGAPYIERGYISVTHARTVAAIAVSDRPVGIDLEYPRPQLLRIASKFLSEDEQRCYVGLPWLLYAWTAKEAAFKACHSMGCPIQVMTDITLWAGDEGLPVRATSHAFPSVSIGLRFETRDDGAILAIAEC